jgi:hypothetical protein
MPAFRITARSWAVSVFAAGALLLALLGGQPAEAACQTGTFTFTSTTADQCYTVPSGVQQISVTAVGAAGATVCFATGGEGASVSADIPVNPGETLYAEVGGVGQVKQANGSCLGGAGAGGTNGGADGGAALGSASAQGGGGGGGASDLRTVPTSDNAQVSLGSRLIVAGGGGGAGGLGFPPQSTGGNAESNGNPSMFGASGGTGGGTGGPGSGGTASSCPGSSAGPSGFDGTFGAGGAGGGGNADFSGGGGGGGGYFGGGGGAGAASDLCAGGGGGGGGSSWVTPAATNQTTPTPTASPAEISIVPLMPSASASPLTVTFPGTQPQSTVSAPQTVSVSNAATATAPMHVLNVSLGGSDPGDFLIGMGCTSAVAPGGSCTLPVYFAPQAHGARSATLSISTDDSAHPTLTVSLSGVGGSLPQGPQGPQGPRGARGPAGSVLLVKCHTVTEKVHHKTKKVQKCSTKRVGSGKKFTIRGRDVVATLSRHGRIYARGTVRHGHLVLTATPRVGPGRYTLTLTSRRGHRWLVRREQVVVK